MEHTEFPTKVTEFSTEQSIEREQESVDPETRSYEETQQANPPPTAVNGVLTGTAIGPTGSPLGITKTAEVAADEKRNK